MAGSESHWSCGPSMAGYETAGRTPLEFFLEGIVFGGLRQSLRIRSAESPQLGVGVRLLMHCFQYFLPPVALSEPWGGRWWGGGEAMAIGIVSPDSRSDQQGSRPLGAAPLLVSSSAEKLAGPPAAFRTATVSGGVISGARRSNTCPSWLTRDHDGRQGVVPILRPRPSVPSRSLKAAILRTQPGLRGIGPAIGSPRGANAQIAVCSTHRRQARVTWPSRRRRRWRQTWTSAAALGGRDGRRLQHLAVALQDRRRQARGGGG
jgi:hypothetical protein